MRSLSGNNGMHLLRRDIVVPCKSFQTEILSLIHNVLSIFEKEYYQSYRLRLCALHEVFYVCHICNFLQFCKKYKKLAIVAIDNLVLQVFGWLMYWNLNACFKATQNLHLDADIGRRRDAGFQGAEIY